jgi:hypothetical protein
MDSPPLTASWTLVRFSTCCLSVDRFLLIADEVIE